ncbi:hypothetical protein GCM10027275_12220 [Rhabdobacter roseus]|uniref:DUF6644 domain-containing protein n=1 Tax=Rhabdobacter roseus TaxID=1655419 RepID=A0A840TT05_9BACT|nr:hypothetical protein [Rhabdobacter roseus]
MLRYLDWLEQTAWAVGIRQSLWLYPALEIVHIVGIVLLVGAAFLFDLRLLGQARYLPVSGLARHLLPWSRRGLWLIVPSGLLLFITNARTLGTDPTFGLKLLLLALAALNVWVFHSFINKSTPDEPPAFSRISAVLSILLWIGVIACGRLLAY